MAQQPWRVLLNFHKVECPNVSTFHCVSSMGMHINLSAIVLLLKICGLNTFFCDRTEPWLERNFGDNINNMIKDTIDIVQTILKQQVQITSVEKLFCQQLFSQYGYYNDLNINMKTN